MQGLWSPVQDYSLSGRLSEKYYQILIQNPIQGLRFTAGPDFVQSFQLRFF